jgi:hypothetical protein
MKEPIPEVIDLTPRPVRKDAWWLKVPDVYELSPDEVVKREAWLTRMREAGL